MDLPHDTRPAGAAFRRITEAVFDAARSLTHLEFRVLFTLYELADYQTLTLRVNRAEVARRVGATRSKVSPAVQSLAEQGFFTPIGRGGIVQLNPAPPSPQGTLVEIKTVPSGDASGKPPRPLRGRSPSPQGTLTVPSGDASAPSPIWNGREEERERERVRAQAAAQPASRACGREAEPDDGPGSLDPITDAIVAWAAGTLPWSAAARLGLVLDNLARQYPILDTATGQDHSPQAVVLALIADLRSRPDTPPPTNFARVRGYADATLRACAGEGRMPGQMLPIHQISAKLQTAAERRERGNYAYDADEAVRMLLTD